MKATDAPGYRGKRGILDRRAARMRAYNLTHGSGCKSTARAIAQRESNAVPTLQSDRKEGQQTFCRWHRIWDWCEAERVAQRGGGK